MLPRAPRARADPGKTAFWFLVQRSHGVARKKKEFKLKTLLPYRHFVNVLNNRPSPACNYLHWYCWLYDFIWLSPSMISLRTCQWFGLRLTCVMLVQAARVRATELRRQMHLIYECVIFRLKQCFSDTTLGKWSDFVWLPLGPQTALYNSCALQVLHKTCKHTLGFKNTAGPTLSASIIVATTAARQGHEKSAS